MADLSGSTALVTGGSRGIGRAIAAGLAAAGSNVVIVARSEGAVSAAAAELNREGSADVLGLPADVTQPAQAAHVVQAAIDRFGSVDILVNNVGAAPFLSAVEFLKPEKVEKYLGVNLLSVITMTVAVADHMLSSGRGCVLNIASIAGWVPSPGLSYYAAAKAAVISFTRSTALEWAPRGVRVNALAPGFVATDMNARARQDDEFNRNVLASVPMGRWCQPEDLVAPAVFLCSSGARFITGAVLTADGGQDLATQTGIVTAP